MLFHIFDLMKIGVDVFWAKDLRNEFLKAIMHSLNKTTGEIVEKTGYDAFSNANFLLTP